MNESFETTRESLEKKQTIDKTEWARKRCRFLAQEIINHCKEIEDISKKFNLDVTWVYTQEIIRYRENAASVKINIPQPILRKEEFVDNNPEIPNEATTKKTVVESGTDGEAEYDINDYDVDVEHGRPVDEYGCLTDGMSDDNYHTAIDWCEFEPEASDVPVSSVNEEVTEPDNQNESAPQPDAKLYYKETQELFKKALLETREVFRSKLIDYGPSWRILRPSSVTDQLVIKASRIRNLEESGMSYVGEGIYPEFQAIVNYGIVALIQARLGASIDIDMNADDALREFDAAMFESFELMCKKNADYHEAWKMMRVKSYTDFILVKLARIKQIEENNGVTKVSEGIESNYMDIVNYAVFGLIKLSGNLA